MKVRAQLVVAGAVIAAASVTSSATGRGAPQQRSVDTGRSTITVRVFKSGLFRAFADNHLIRADLAEGWVDDSGTPRVDILVDARRLRVLDPDASSQDREQVQARMLGPDVLDTMRFPQIRFRSTDVRQVDPDRWLVRGSIELHGRAHDTSMEVVRENGHYRGRTKLRQTDFGIKPVSVAGGTVKVKDEVAIEVDIVTRTGPVP